MITRYSEWFKYSNQPNWLSVTRDASGKEVWFSAEQFKKYMPSEDPYMTTWDFVFSYDISHTVLTVALAYPELNPALSCTWYHRSILGERNIAEPTNTAEYAARAALVTNAATLDDESDHHALWHYCRSRVLPHHWQLRRSEPQPYSTPECAKFEEEFVPAWIEAYKSASVHRMKACGSQYDLAQYIVPVKFVSQVQK